MTPIVIYCRRKTVCGDDAFDTGRSTVSRWVVKFHDSESGKTYVDEKRTGHPITATDDKYSKLVDNLIQSNQRITQHYITNHIGIP